jgi:hypothetical protein
MNCVDPLGKGALSLAIDGENLEMVELLIIMGVETKNALLQAIDVGFVEAAELLLEHEELIHKDGEPYVSHITGKLLPQLLLTQDIKLVQYVSMVIKCLYTLHQILVTRSRIMRWAGHVASLERMRHK